ncbi:MAG: phenylalanine--tRNA ligase subunit beta [Thermoanaerobaculia bacterium]
MELSFNWLSQYVDHGATVDEVAARLTAAGLAVEGMEERGGDYLLDVDVTTNRPDCMNHLGLAREVAVVFDKPLDVPDARPEELAKRTADEVTLTLEDPVGCSRYVARLVEGVEVGPSPEGLVERLESIGQRPINNIVDITNFVLWETGQPIHAFDFDKLRGRAIVVRRAQGGELLVTLDGERRELGPEVLVIADAERAVALAGIMGGLETEVTESTKNVLIESAHFDPRVIRAGAKRLDLHTDASHRFERGADPGACLDAATRVAALIAEVAGGRVVGGAVDERNENLDWRLEGELDLARLDRFAGAEISAESVERWYAGLGFELEGKDAGRWSVAVPSWRYYDFKPDPGDAPGRSSRPVYEADLFEEAIRLYGMDKIPSGLPTLAGPDAGSSEGHERREQIRRHLAACGYTEAINYAFQDAESEVVYPALERQGDPIRLANPLSELYTVMRRSLLPNLVAAAHFNLQRGAAAIRLFEIGHVFPGAESPEVEAVALIGGGSLGMPWDRKSELDLFDLKGVLDALAWHFGARLEYRPAEIPKLISGTDSELYVEDAPERRLGYMGQLEEDSAFPLFAAELEASFFDRAGIPQVRTPSRFPGIEADLTLTHSRDTSWSEIASAIAAAGSPDLVTYGLKDRYRGKGVPEGAVNTTIYFVYNADERTLTQEEVNERHQDLVRDLENQFGWRG